MNDQYKLSAVNDLLGLKKLVEDEATPIDVNAPDRFGALPIIWAVRQGNMEIVQYLVGKEDAVDCQGYGGITPLQHAANTVQQDLVDYLIKSGADVNMKDEAGNTALRMGVRERAFLGP